MAPGWVVNDLGGSTHGEGASASAADKVVAEIRAAGSSAVANHDSVTDGGGIVENALDAFGRVDVVVNNAGIQRDKTFHKMEDADWDLVYQVRRRRLQGPRAAWPHLREQAYGRVVFTSPRPQASTATSARATAAWPSSASTALTCTLALEGRKNNILVNAIAPTGGARMTEGLIPPPRSSSSSSRSWSACWWSTSAARPARDTSPL